MQYKYSWEKIEREEIFLKSLKKSLREITKEFKAAKVFEEKNPNHESFYKDSTRLLITKGGFEKRIEEIKTLIKEMKKVKYVYLVSSWTHETYNGLVGCYKTRKLAEAEIVDQKKHDWNKIKSDFNLVEIEVEDK